MSDLYDSVFRTILNDCRKLILPVINEAFGENYSGDEEIEFFPNEHYISQKDDEPQKRITDTNFMVHGVRNKKYHWECQSMPDSRMLIRLFEYDAQIALDQGEVADEKLIVSFPHSAVLYLRCSRKTPDKYTCVIETPGGTVTYDVPILKMYSYSLDDIFDKKLLLLIPFYIFLFEKDFKEYNSNKQKLIELEAEYEAILEHLDELQKKGFIGAFDRHTIIELSGNVVDEIAKKYENIRKGVGDIMGGTLLETEARTIRDEGITQGIAQGIAQGITQGISQGIAQGETLLASLLSKLFADGRIEDAKLAAIDENARKLFYKEYGMTD